MLDKLTIKILDLVIQKLCLLGGAVLLEIRGYGILLLGGLLLHWHRDVLKRHRLLLMVKEYKKWKWRGCY